MADFSSKELYMMNGGNKLYIYKDGFGDIYTGTAAEEAEWQKEVIDRELSKLDTEENSVVLKFAIDNLHFHKYKDLLPLLIQLSENASPKRKVVFAGCLWTLSKYAKSFSMIHDVLVHHRDNCLNEVFNAFQDLKDNEATNKFLLSCLEGNDDELLIKAQMTLSMWSYTGIPALRANQLLEELKPGNREREKFKTALVELKRILKDRNR